MSEPVTEESQPEPALPAPPVLTQERFDQLQKENTILRGMIAKQDGPCVHCSLEDMARCPFGFPGCARADDIMCADDLMHQSLLTRLRAEEDSALTNKMVIRYLHTHLPSGDPALARIVRAVDQAHTAQNELLLLEMIKEPPQGIPEDDIVPTAG